MNGMGLGSAPSLLCGFGKVASGHRDERGMTDRALKEQSQGTRAAYLRGDIPLAEGPGGPSASSVPPPDSLIPELPLPLKLLPSGVPQLS